MSCKCKTEVYSRVVGYYRPVSEWNPGEHVVAPSRRRFVEENLHLAELALDAQDAPVGRGARGARGAGG